MDLFKILGIVAVETDEANRALDGVSGKAESSEGKITKAFAKIGKAVATYFAVDKIIAFGKECVNVAAEVSAQASAFSQIMVDSSGASYVEEAAAKMSALADEVGMVDTRLTPYMTSMSAKFKGLGYGVEDATDLATRGLTIAADASAFWDKSLDESMSHLNSFINGSYEGGEAIGLFANDTQMAAYAVESGLIKATKEWSSLDEATKQATRLEYAENMFELSGATGQAAKEADQYANVQANLTEKWRQFKAQIGEPLLQNIVIPAMEKLSGVVDYLSTDVFPALQSVAGDVGEFWREVLQPAISAVGEAFGELFAPISDLIPEFDAGAAAMNVFREACWFLEEVLLWVAENVQTIFAPAIELFSELWGKLTKAIQPVIDKLREYFTSGQAAEKGSAALGVVLAILSAALQAVITIIIAVIDTINWLVEAFNTVKDKASEIVNNIPVYFEQLKQSLAEIWSNIKTNVATTWNSIKEAVANKASEIFSTVSEKFNNIKSKITETIENARDKVKEAIEKMKGFFKFEWSLPKIKLPHFRINGTFSLNPPSAPKFAVDWYAKGGVLEEPTIFGMNGNRLMGGGEAGAEAVAPIDVLQGYVAEAVASQNAGMVTVLEKILDAIMLMDANMGGNLREALDGTSLSINHREFGRLVKAVN
jgi:uncharacterized protein YjbJ (UPF0337 family)